jgi:hypothetical protein
LRVAVVRSGTRPPAPSALRPARHARPFGGSLGGSGGRRLTGGAQGLTSEIRPSGAGVRPIGRRDGVYDCVRTGMLSANGRRTAVPRPGDNCPRSARDGRLARVDGRSPPLLITSRAGVIHSIHNLVHNRG